MIQWEEDVTDKGGWDFMKEIISKSFFRGFTRALDLTGAKNGLKFQMRENGTMKN